MGNPLQKGIDSIDTLLEEPTPENIKAAIDVLAGLTKDTTTFNYVNPIRAEMIQFKSDKLAGFNMDGRLNKIIVSFQEIYKEFKQASSHTQSSNQDYNYTLLCKLNFSHQTAYFLSLMKGDKKFISFVIRGPEANYGQRWLANKLIQDSRNDELLHEPLGLDFLQLKLNLDSFVEHLARALGVSYQQNMTLPAKRIKLKNELVKRIQTGSQFIILINSYNFIHSDEYQDFLSLIKYLSDEINNADISYKCIFLFVEEQTSARYAYTDDCIFSEEMKYFKARMIQEFRFIDLGLTTPIKPDNVLEWLGYCTDEQLGCFELQQEQECEMLNFIGDGNPQFVIPMICNKIGINYIEKEKIWLKY